MSLTEAASLQLTQLAATQRHRAKLPEASASESQALGSRKATARTRKDLAVEVSRARVEALLTGVSAPLLALAGQRASLQLTPDQRLALENYLLNLEEAELKRQVSALEAEAEALVARERAAKAALDAIPSELQRLQQQAAEVKSADSQEILASEAIVEASLRAVREASQAEMARVLGSWDILEGEARGAVGVEVAGEIVGAAEGAERELERYTEGARAKAKALAGGLADAAASEYDTHLAPLLARLEESRTQALARGATLSGVRESLVQLADALHAGVDPGTDIAPLIAAFPAGLEQQQQWGGGSGSGSASAGGENGGGVVDSSGIGRLRDALAALEVSDAEALGFSREVAREELSGLLDSVAAAWASHGRGGPGEASTFFRELLAVLSAGCEPAVVGGGGGGGGGAAAAAASHKAGGIDIVEAVRLETTRWAPTIHQDS